MTFKSSVSLTDQQAAFARRLVEEGRYSSMSAVIQQGLELMRKEDEAADAETAAFVQMIEERMAGPFVSMEEFRGMVDDMISEESKKLGLDG